MDFVDSECGESKRGVEDEDPPLECDETQEDIEHAEEEAKLAREAEEEEKEYQAWRKEQLDEAHSLETSSYMDDNLVRRVYRGTSHYANLRKAKRIVNEVEQHDHHRQNPERRVFGPQLAMQRERDRHKARDRERQEAKEREEADRRDSARQRPPANDWYCDDRMEVTGINDIIERLESFPDAEETYYIKESII